MTDRYAVIGNPVAHSRSPQIHAAFARATGQDIAYEALLAPLDGFAATVAAFRAAGGRGANVTLPFKLEAYRLATETSRRAREAEAVNTLKFDGAAIYGDNTDGAGLVRDLTANLGCEISGRRVLLVGAGGAGHGVMGPLLAAAPALLVVANRTADRALALADKFARAYPGRSVGGCGFAELAGRSFDLVINATSSGLEGAAPDLPHGLFARGALAYDMVYGKGRTPFLAFAAAEGAGRLAEGIGMLVEQAAESFLLWRGVRPETRALIAELATP